MNAPHADTGTRTFLRWSWRILVALLLATIALGIADRQIRQAPHLGFIPRHADWVLASNDLPGVWSGLESTDAYSSLTEEIPSPLHPIQLWGRQLTGIRWTPSRWRVWLGDTCTLASVDGETVAVVHPGILLRTADRLAHAFKLSGSSEGVFSVDTLFYAWRDGFLIASASKKLVVDALAADAREIPMEKRTSIRWRGAFANRSFELALELSSGLPLELIMDGAGATSEMPLPPGPLPAEIARIQGLDIAVLRDIVDRLAEDYASPSTQQQFADILAQLPKRSSNTALTLARINVSELRLLVEPEFFVIASDPPHRQSPHDAIPYYWDDTIGWVLPWWGEAFTLCGATDERRAYFATTQTAMSENLAAAQSATSNESARIYVNWVPLAAAFEHVLLQAADYELLPHLNRLDANRDAAPYARAMASLGTTTLTGGVEHGRLLVRGNLDGPVEEAAGP